MAATYTPVSLKDMETFFKRGYHGMKLAKSVQRGEVVFDLYLEPNLGVRVWSSLNPSSESSAGVGEDAIRVQYYNFGLSRPMTAGKAPIVKRTQGWRDSLRDRIEDVVELYGEQDFVRDAQVDMLRALLKSGRLDGSTVNAFTGMLKNLETSTFMSLSDKQREWVESKTKALGL
jgi:hypothetical protein